jgi:predicted Zn-dependent protease
MLRIRQNRDHEAESLFREALEANPENTFALFNYARFLLQRARKFEAIPYAELLVELEPRNPQARDLLRQASELGTGSATRSPTKE